MANHCYNSLLLENLSPDQWKEFIDACVAGETEVGGFLTTLHPEPDYTVTPVPKLFPQIDASRAETEEEKQKILKNEGTIRENSWWDWRNMNWGTKWIDYSCIQGEYPKEPSTDFSISFESAWSPLNQDCMEELSKKFPGATLVNFYEEEGNDFCGVTVAKDGVSEGHYEPEMHQYKEPFLRQQFPDLEDRLAGYLDETDGDREEALQEFFWNESDLGEFSDFVRDQLEEKLEPMLSRVIAATSAISEELTK